ncbi:TetR/AcrR family transcriptional regulator [Streptomyces sp. ICBB 8177]|uniref:TetR/AcrR family transcriptional regulator n=1 Tax=Streptomyces sp. ICBB 8177 TaxID=563922 RepID=UPI000D67483F|nr:TetR/AcrR family transcriptional regulator [Streptomyces sp. ICBB 8177]PWI42743.1 tetracycline repressor protein class H [Streptomyces sp. ICBB 8177]
MTDRRKRGRGERAGLTRQSVLDAALELADRKGLRALSMRALGAELGVEAMTLYHYVPHKDALLDGIVERAVDEIALPAADDGADWRDAMRAYAESLRNTLLRHPGVLPLVATRPAATPGTLRAVERGLTVLRAAGLPLGRAVDTLNTLSLFVIAHTAAEVASAPVNEAGAAGSPQALAELDPQDFPLIAAAARTGSGTDDAERFRFGVQALITGCAALLGEPDRG